MIPSPRGRAARDGDPPSPSQSWSRVTALLAAAVLAAAGCTGAITGDNLTGGGSQGDPATGGSAPGGKNPGSAPSGPGLPSDPKAGALPDSATVPAEAPLRRLTVLEYQNTVRDLLGVQASAVPIAGFAADQDSALSGYARGSSLTTGNDARAFMNSATALASLAVEQVDKIVPCTPVPADAAAQAECAATFIRDFGLRAFRRPVSDEETTQLTALYETQRSPDVGASFEDAIGTLVGAMLQTPYFLYHWELGPYEPIKESGNVVRYNPYEMASRLTYLFWSSMPDERLFKAAGDAGLTSPEQIAEEARRLLADPKAAGALEDFHLQWLTIVGLKDIPKDPSFTNYSAEVAQAMTQETREFVKSVYMGDSADGKLETLLTSTKSFVNEGLAKIYGVGKTGADFAPVDLDSTERAGILTQGAFLAAKADPGESHPVKRGDTLVHRLLCMELEVPPGLEVPPVEDPSPDKTTRERYEVHGEAACAKGCHQYLDPLGFAFENYDAVGAFRTMENGKPVDATGSFDLKSGTITFKNAVDLVGQLATTPEVHACMVKQWFRYGLKRHEVSSEEPSIKVLEEAFNTKGHDMRELMVALTKTRAFTHRTLSAGEVSP